MCMHLLHTRPQCPHKECNFTDISKKRCSSSHSEIELELFASEATPNPTLHEKVAEIGRGGGGGGGGGDKASLYIAALAEDSK